MMGLAIVARQVWAVHCCALSQVSCCALSQVSCAAFSALQILMGGPWIFAPITGWQSSWLVSLCDLGWQVHWPYSL